MNKDFLELWGNLCLNAAQGQKQIEDFIKWTKQGLMGAEKQTAMFSQFYGLEQLSQDHPKYMELWEKGAKDFQKSFKEFLDTMGLVSRDEHLSLIRKYEQLKKENEDLRETVQHLRLLHEEKGASQMLANEGFKELMVKQSEQFQELMEGFSNYVKENADPKPSKK